MNEARSQPWYQLYAAAVVELDPKQLIERVDATEAAVIDHAAAFRLSI
jgi:hypothetical protein